MRVSVRFIMEVPKELMTLDGTEPNLNALAEAVSLDLPVKWNAKVVEVYQK